MSDGDIFTNMAGRSAVETFTRRASSIREGATPRLRVDELAGQGLNPVSFALAPGECLGVAGLEGQGQSALFRTLVGLTPARAGTMAIDGAAVRIHSTRGARDKGVVLVPEDRKAEGLFADLSTLANISLPVIGDASRLGLVDQAAERKSVARVTPSVDLSERYLGRNIGALSGGNQQKAILARALVTRAKCLLLFDPTRGVDVGAKQSIYAMMANFVDSGGSILFYSTELDELVHLCERVLVVYGGRIAGELRDSELTQAAILALASGVADYATEPTSSLVRGGALMRGGVGWIRAAAASPVLPAFVLLVLMFGVYASRDPSALTAFGFGSLVNNGIVLAVAASGLTLVVLSGELDLSGSGVVAIANVVVATTSTGRLGSLGSLAAVLAIGLAVGCINGCLVTIFGLQSLAVTIGTLIACQGVAC